MEQINQEQSGCLYQESDFRAVTDNEKLKAEAKDEDDATEDEFFEAHENQDWYEDDGLDKNFVKMNLSKEELQCSQTSSKYSFECLSPIKAENTSREEIADGYKQQSENSADISNLKLAPQHYLQHSMSSGYVSAAGRPQVVPSQYPQQQVRHHQTLALPTELSNPLRESTKTNDTFQHILLPENVSFEGNINYGQFGDTPMQPTFITNEQSPNTQRQVSSMYIPQRPHGQEMGVSVPFHHYNPQINQHQSTDALPLQHQQYRNQYPQTQYVQYGFPYPVRRPYVAPEANWHYQTHLPRPEHGNFQPYFAPEAKWHNQMHLPSPEHGNFQPNFAPEANWHKQTHLPSAEHGNFQPNFAPEANRHYQMHIPNPEHGNFQHIQPGQKTQKQQHLSSQRRIETSQKILPTNKARSYQNVPNLYDTPQKATISMEKTRDVMPSTEAEKSESSTIAVRGLKSSITEELIRKYFENTGRSGGSKVTEVIRGARKGVTYITFKEKRAAVDVVSRRQSLDGCELQVSIARPPEMLPNCVLLRNLHNVASGQELRNFVEINTAVKVQSVRFAEDETAAVITFQSNICFQEIQSAITKNELNGESLTVEPVPETDTVVVRFQDDYNPTKEILVLHFENTRRSGGGEVADTEILYDKLYALVTFVDAKVVADVIRKQHITDGHVLTVSAFLECLGVHGGSEQPLIKSVQPVPISEDDRWKIDLIKDSLFFHNAFDRALTEHHACVNWSDPSGTTHLSCTLTPETDGARQLVKTWSKDALKTLHKFLNTIRVTQVMVKEEELTKALKDLAKFVNDERVHIRFNKQTEECFIVENTDNNNTIDIVACINRVKENLHREKNRKCKSIPVHKGKLLLLHRCEFESKLKHKYSEFLMSYNFDSSCLEMEGLTEEIIEMENLLEVTLKKVISLKHSWDSKLMTDLMAHPAAIEAFEHACFGIASKTVVLCTVTGFEVHSFDEREAKTTLHKGQSLVKQSRIPLKDENREVLRSTQWEELKNSILTGSQGLILMQELDCLDIVGVVTTLENEVRILTDFLEENSIVQKSIPIDQVFGQMLQSYIAENIDNLRQQEARFQIEEYNFDGTSAILVKGNITGIQIVEGICNKFTNTLICVKMTLTRPCLGVCLGSSDWKYNRLEIEDKLKCKILEPRDCPSRYVELDKNDDVKTEGQSDCQTTRTAAFVDRGVSTALTVPTKDGSEFSSDDNQVLEYYHFRHNIEKVTLVFAANCRETVDAASKEVLTYYQSQITTRTVEEPEIKNWSQHYIDLLIGASKAANLDISVYKQLGKLELTGLKKSIRQFDVDRNVREATEDVYKRENARRMAQKVQWNTIMKGHKFKPYDEISNFEIETAYQAKLPCAYIKYPHSNVSYSINFSTMQECLENQVDVKDCERIQVVRRDLLQELTMKAPLPKCWAKMAPNDFIDVVPLRKGGNEYEEISKVFKQSCKPVKVCICKIERIQNITLYNQYCALKWSVQNQMPSISCERDKLWHGTNEYAFDRIIHNGFNRNYNNQNENAYGNGVYFATEANHSIKDEYAKASTDGTRNVFLCRAVVGEYIKGEKNMSTLPQIPTCSDRCYNSAVDDVRNPKIFVIFNDVQAYPEYLINFK